MEPKIKDFSEDNDILKFTLYDCNYSIANSIRRTILSDIETVVIATDDDSVLVNTSRLNNEIIKQRLGCIPVHIVDKNIPIKNYIADKYKKQIEDSDVDFFMSKNYTDDLVDVSNSQYVIKTINRLKKPIAKMDDNNKNKCMKYLQNLSKLSELYFD